MTITQFDRHAEELALPLDPNNTHATHVTHAHPWLQVTPRKSLTSCIHKTKQHEKIALFHLLVSPNSHVVAHRRVTAANEPMHTKRSNFLTSVLHTDTSKPSLVFYLFDNLKIAPIQASVNFTSKSSVQRWYCGKDDPCRVGRLPVSTGNSIGKDNPPNTHGGHNVNIS